MPIQSATASGADLSTVLTSALSDLLDDEVTITTELPAGVGLRDVRVEVAAAVVRDDDSTEDGGLPADTPEDASAAADAAAAAAADAAADASDDDVEDDADDHEDVTTHDPRDHDGEDAAPALLSEEELDELDEEADAGADFVEGLLDAMDLPGELQIRVLEDTRRAEVEVVDMDSGALIGRRGSTLEAIQELMRCALQSQFERRVHVHVDVEGYRARRLEKLLDKADEAIDQVLDTGEPERLEPMDVFERKAIHEFVNTVEGVLSRSQGREPSRRVVIEPVD